jgi:hypothetical protein
MEEGLYQIESLFQSTAEKVIAAQKELDDKLNRSYLSACEVGGHSRLYSIPRVTVNFRFGLSINHQKKWLMLIPKGDSRLEQQTHQLTFSLIATPEPPPTLEAAGAADGDNSALPPIYVREPFFLVPAKEEARVCLRLINALGSGLTGDWVSAVPGPSGGVKELTQKFVSSEVANIMLAMKNKTGERGMVFFRYEGTPTSYLIVRVVGSDANDSVFVLTPGARPKVVIYSIDGDNTKEIRYEPLHHFTYTIRRWLLGDLPSSSEEHAEGMDLQYGLQYLQPFAQNMRLGYINALKYLSAAEAPNADGSGQASAVYYDLANVSAKLTYSLEYNAKAEAAVKFKFDSSPTASGAGLAAAGAEDDVELIGSRVVIKAERVRNAARLEIELNTPEFALSGAPLKKFLEIASRSVQPIVKAFDNDDRYAGFIKGETYRRGVVALLSYRGSLKEEFLVIWPGENQGQSRDFAFTCKLDEKTIDHNKVTVLDGIEVVMRVQDNLAEVHIGTDIDSAAGTDLSGKQYRVFHNFFHAVRIWRARINTSG